MKQLEDRAIRAAVILLLLACLCAAVLVAIGIRKDVQGRVPEARLVQTVTLPPPPEVSPCAELISVSFRV